MPPKAGGLGGRPVRPSLAQFFSAARCSAEGPERFVNRSALQHCQGRSRGLLAELHQTNAREDQRRARDAVQPQPFLEQIGGNQCDEQHAALAQGGHKSHRGLRKRPYRDPVRPDLQGSCDSAQRKRAPIDAEGGLTFPAENHERRGQAVANGQEDRKTQRGLRSAAEALRAPSRPPGSRARARRHARSDRHAPGHRACRPEAARSGRSCGYRWRAPAATIPSMHEVR